MHSLRSSTPRLPPLPQLMVVGELCQAAAEGRSDAVADELVLLFASKCVETVQGERVYGTMLGVDPQQYLVRLSTRFAAPR